MRPYGPHDPGRIATESGHLSACMSYSGCRQACDRLATATAGAMADEIDLCRADLNREEQIALLPSVVDGGLDHLGDGVFVHAIGRHVEGAGADLPGRRRPSWPAPRPVHRTHPRVRPWRPDGRACRTVAEPKPPAPPV